MSHYFHFTLGPVQGFVAQARRTRDFWAGSFLLSWLAAVAIKSVQKQGGTIIFPEIKEDNNFLAYLEGDKSKGKPPQQGSIPNRFKAEIKDLENFNPELVTEAVIEAWSSLADDIWNKDIVDIKAIDSTSRHIWDRQIKNFWDMSWIVTDDIEDGSVLDQRKNWRSYIAPDEDGVKCSVMDGWQELSGIETPNRKAMEQQFWQPLRESGKTGIKSDLAEGEALCAIAFVKRRFSRYFKDFVHPMSQGWTLKGWDIPSAVPSVSYMAAVHFLEALIKNAEEKELKSFVKEAHKLTQEYGEWSTSIACIDTALTKNKQKQIATLTSALDGNVFFETALENSNIYDQDQAKEVISTLKALRNSVNIDPVSPFYAVLMMDGDSLGKQMSQRDNQKAITKGLAKFTDKVASIVHKNNGFLIYAGGDDVLAILPLEDALICARELRQHYMDCFNDYDDINTTLSGAIEYVHIKTPLTKILKDAHHLLDDIAKEKTGRDAIAIRVWKPGGLQIEWAQPWETALDGNEDNLTHLEQLTKEFTGTEEKNPQFSSKFLYKIRERFDLLNPDQNDKEQKAIFNEQQAIDLMAMEYLNSATTNQPTMEEAKKIVKKLLTQCRPVKRELEESKSSRSKYSLSPIINPYGALLVRFLAHKGVER